MRECSFDRPYALVGSRADCDVVLDDVASRALLVLATRRGVRAVVLATNSKRAGRRVVIAPDEPLKLGSQEVVVRASCDAVPEESDENRFLHVLSWKSGDFISQMVLPEETPILIGRKSPAHLVLDDGRLSGIHCCVFRSGNRVWAIDLGSANGIRVGERTDNCCELELGNTLRIGGQRLRYRRFASSDSPSPLEGRVAELEMELESKRSETSELKEKLSQVETDSASIRELERTLRSELSTVHAELSSFRFLNQRVERQLKSTGNNARALSEQVSKKNEECTTLRNELTAVTDQCDLVRKELSEREQQLAVVESIFEQQRVRCEDQEQRLAASEERISELERSLQEQQSLVEASDAQLAEQRATIEEQEARLTGLREECESLRSQLGAEFPARVARREAELERREAELDQLQEELRIERAVLRSLQQDVQQPQQADSVDETAEVDDDVIGQHDFHHVLDEALQALPRVPGERRPR